MLAANCGVVVVGARPQLAGEQLLTDSQDGDDSVIVDGDERAGNVGTMDG
jgi:hypothetical protein